MLSDHHPRRQNTPADNPFAAGNPFTFSPNSDPNNYTAWAETLKTQPNPFSKPNPRPKLSPWVRPIPILSPPLFNPTSPETTTKTTRAQAIANYRQEMMDLVRTLPETTYELSLKDIVDFPAAAVEAEEEDAAMTEIGEIRKGVGIRSRVRDSGSFLMKFVMPNVSKDGGSSGGCSKLSPRRAEYGERRCGSDGSSDSGCSGGGRRLQRWKLLASCYSFLYRRRRSRS